MAKLDPVFHQLFEAQPTKGDLKRLEIIKAAVICIGRDGFEGGTFEKVAQRLKTRRSHVAYYFKSRDELLEGVVQYTIATAQQITIELLTGKNSPIEQLVAIGQAAFEWSDRHPDQAKVLTYFYYACASDPKMRKLNTQIRDAGYARIRALIGLVVGIESASHPSSLDTTARSLHAVMTGLVLDYVTTERTKGHPGPDYRSLCESACRNLSPPA